MDLLTDPRAWLAVLGLSVVGIGISLGAYQAGRRGKSTVRERFSSISPDRWDQVQGYYDRWGSGILLMSSIPGLATVLTVGAGMFGIRLIPFLIWVTISKLTRNWLIVLLLYGGYQRFFAG
jgi:membrane protein YqaA with SNARE-associated domain